jgi:hypothetical protein
MHHSWRPSTSGWEQLEFLGSGHGPLGIIKRIRRHTLHPLSRINSSIVMAKDKALQGPGETPPNDQAHGCCAIFKGLFNKQNITPQSIPPALPTLPAVSPANRDNDVEPRVTPAPAPANQKGKEPQVNTIPDESISKDDDAPQTSREEKANAKFRNAKVELEKVISKPNTVSPIHLSSLDSSEIGNLPQMARDIDLAISEFMKERAQQKETQKGKAVAKNLAHKVAFAGQKILRSASSVASVGSNSGFTKSRNSSPPPLAA